MKTQNLWDTAKAVLRGKFTVIQAFKKPEKSQTSQQKEEDDKDMEGGTSLVVQWLRLTLPVQGARV